MKKVLQIPNYFYPNIGGIEQTSQDIARAIGNDYEQRIICFNETASGDGYNCIRSETINEIVHGIDVTRCGCVTKIFSQSISLTYAKQLDKIMKEFNPDIVVFHYPNPFVASFFLKYRKQKFKFVLYWHLDITKQKSLGKLFHQQTLHLLDWADKIVATSPNYVNGSPYLKKYKEKCTVIPSCIDTSRLVLNEKRSEISKVIRKKYKDKIICFGIGRHVEYKGYTYLIEAVKYLDDRFVILIGGTGDLTGSLKEQAKNLHNVKFLGRISDDELVGYMDSCDIFCFPSITKNEAFGLALAEGMYFGKPAVTFTIPGSGVNYVNLNGVTGIECPNADSKAYAMALKKLSDHPELCKQYGENARKRVLENFTYDIFHEKILKLIDTF